jgi:methylmalonyl-CoA mutase cobalamin-binding subunit
MAAVLGAALGWRALYLGANLPAEEVASAASQTGARAVVLSIEYSAETSALAGEVRKLARYLDEGVTLILGGPSAEWTVGTLGKKAVLVQDMEGFRKKLRQLAAA